MTQPEMSRRVGVLMSTQAVMALNHDNKMALLNAVGQASDLSDLTSEFQGVVLEAEKELEAKGYVRDHYGRLVPPAVAGEPEPSNSKEHIYIKLPKKQGKLLMAAKGNAKSGNYAHAGIPGHVGGSAPKGKGGTGSMEVAPKPADMSQERYDAAKLGIAKMMAATTPLAKKTAAQEAKDEAKRREAEQAKVYAKPAGTAKYDRQGNPKITKPNMPDANIVVSGNVISGKILDPAPLVAAVNESGFQVTKISGYWSGVDRHYDVHFKDPNKVSIPGVSKGARTKKNAEQA